MIEHAFVSSLTHSRIFPRLLWVDQRKPQRPCHDTKLGGLNVTPSHDTKLVGLKETPSDDTKLGGLKETPKAKP